jgi:hypothetical protein
MQVFPVLKPTVRTRCQDSFKAAPADTSIEGFAEIQFDHHRRRNFAPVATRNFQKFQEACLVGVSGAGAVTEQYPERSWSSFPLSRQAITRWDGKRLGTGWVDQRTSEVARQGRRRHGSEKTVFRHRRGGWVRWCSYRGLRFHRCMPCIGGVDAGRLFAVTPTIPTLENAPQVDLCSPERGGMLALCWGHCGRASTYRDFQMQSRTREIYTHASSVQTAQSRGS